MGRSSRWALVRLAALTLAALVLATPGRAAGIDQYKVKGAFLYSFAKFVDWPADSQVGSDGELRVCVFGNREVTSVLSEVMRGKGAGKRAVTVRRVDDLTSAGWCRIFFVTKSAGIEPWSVANALGAASILTVGETSGAASQGLMINFIIQESKIRFEINQNAAERAGLKISSKLLRLATALVD